MDKKFYSTIDRVKQFIDYKGLSIRKFSETIGISHSLLNNTKSLGSDKLESILSVYSDLSPEWLLTGKGKMLRIENNVANEASPTYDRNIIELHPEAKANCFVADVKASAGLGSLIESKSKLEDLPAISLFNAPHGLNIAFQIEGDSMHNTIRHLDYVAGNHITDINDVKDGYVYILIEKSGGATCKRVYKEKGVFRIVSDNPTYPEYYLGDGDIVAFFKAFQRISSDFRNYFDDVRLDVQELKKGFGEIKRQLSLLQQNRT